MWWPLVKPVSSYCADKIVLQTDRMGDKNTPPAQRPRGNKSWLQTTRPRECYQTRQHWRKSSQHWAGRAHIGPASMLHWTRLITYRFGTYVGRHTLSVCVCVCGSFDLNAITKRYSTYHRKIFKADICCIYVVVGGPTTKLVASGQFPV